MNRLPTGFFSVGRMLRLFLAATLLGLLANTASAENRKTDVVYLKNGDRITGEFKEFVQGQLEVSTTDMGSIYIKWEAIDHIASDKYIEFELTDGQRVFGMVPASDKSASGLMQMRTTKDEIVPIQMDKVVRAEQIRVNDSFWTRLEGYAGIGLNFTKSSDILTWNMNANAQYRTRKHLTTLAFDFTLTTKGDAQDQGNGTRRSNLALSRQWALDNRWFLFSTAGAQRNDELGLESRYFLAGGSGRYLKQNQKTEIYLAGGLSVNQEKTTDSTGADPSNTDTGGNNLEGVIAFNWTFFRLYSPKTRIDFLTQVYPGITQSGRLRGTTNIFLRQELIKDLFWELQTYYDYDNKPLEGAEATSDYGVITSLGYQF